jgi:hypothetical protein
VSLTCTAYIYFSGFTCTASVFAPESGVPASKPSFEAVLDLLGLHRESKGRRFLSEQHQQGSNTLLALLELIRAEMSPRPGTTNANCQTSSAPTETLDDKMTGINERYMSLLAAEQAAPFKNLEVNFVSLCVPRIFAQRPNRRSRCRVVCVCVCAICM